jgi:hypothetical protein
MVTRQIIQRMQMYIILCFFSECLRKSARGEVTIRSPGTGLITINNKSIEYFQHIQDREQVRCTSLSLMYIEEQQSETGSCFGNFIIFVGNINTYKYSKTWPRQNMKKAETCSV